MFYWYVIKFFLASLELLRRLKLFPKMDVQPQRHIYKQGFYLTIVAENVEFGICDFWNFDKFFTFFEVENPITEFR